MAADRWASVRRFRGRFPRGIQKLAAGADGEASSATGVNSGTQSGSPSCDREGSSLMMKHGPAFCEWRIREAWLFGPAGTTAGMVETSKLDGGTSFGDGPA